AQEKSEYRGMGTTLSALLLLDRKAEIYNVGDSRIYLFSDNGLFQLTEDHSIVWEKYRQRMISKEDIITQPEKNLVTQAIGFLPSCKIFSDSIELPEKYIILICSDGLTDVIPDRKIENLLSRTKNLDNALKSLYQISQNNGSRDDVTMILISNFLK
ncbi:MAG: serine/threonine-protein phosphatase, partial [Candidatus Cloacimonetes bacterium]|nr:serine/threonine-protein phosphatase [Candidatus Cloacimonadota bacterium]